MRSLEIRGTGGIEWVLVVGRRIHPIFLDLLRGADKDFGITETSERQLLGIESRVHRAIAEEGECHRIQFVVLFCGHTSRHEETFQTEECHTVECGTRNQNRAC